MEKLLWHIVIIAQVDYEGEKSYMWEFEYLRKDILKQKANLQVRYSILRYNEKEEETFVESIKYTESSDFPVHEIVNITQHWNQYGSIRNREFLLQFLENFIFGDGTLSERYMLILWGHGTGFHLFDNANTANEWINGHLQSTESLSGGEPSNLIDKKKELETVFNTYSFLYTHLSPASSNENPVVYDDIDLGKLFSRSSAVALPLSAERFAYVLQKCFSDRNKKIEVLIVNNCWLQLLDTAYAFKDHVNLLVASQTVLPFGGFNYNRLFKKLHKKHALIDIKEIADNLRKNLVPKYWKGKFAKRYDEYYRQVINPFDTAQLSFSAFDLTQFDAVFDVVEKFAKMFCDKLNLNDDSSRELLYCINNARAGCGEFTSSSGFIDFTNFLNNFCKIQRIYTDKEMNIIYKEYRLAIENARLATFSSSIFFECEVIKTAMPLQSKSPFFFSVFFPPRDVRNTMLRYYQSYYEGTTQSNFGAKSKWAEFIRLKMAIESQ